MDSQFERREVSLALAEFQFERAVRKNRCLNVVTLAMILLAQIASGQFAYKKIVSMGSASDTGSTPFASLIEGPEGLLYGTTYSGGFSNSGTIFRLSKDGSNYQILHLFRGTPLDGAHPYATLGLGTNGVLYGTTEFGGSNSAGAVFKVNRDGTGYRVLMHGGTGDVGTYPRGQLIVGDDGDLYGTTRFGGPSGFGTVYKMHHDGSGFQVVYGFPAHSETGWEQRAGLLKASDGKFYGTCFEGGSNALGTVFSLSHDGSNFKVLYHFKGATFADGAGPHSPLIEGRDGFLYGTTQAGGLLSTAPPSSYPGWGTVFRIRADGSDYRVLHLMDDTHGEPGVIYGGLVEGDDGAIYGTCLAGPGLTGAGGVYRLERDGTNFNVLRLFGPSVHLQGAFQVAVLFTESTRMVVSISQFEASLQGRITQLRSVL